MATDFPKLILYSDIVLNVAIEFKVAGIDFSGLHMYKSTSAINEITGFPPSILIPDTSELVLIISARGLINNVNSKGERGHHVYNPYEL